MKNLISKVPTKHLKELIIFGVLNQLLKWLEEKATKAANDKAN